MAQARRR